MNTRMTCPDAFFNSHTLPTMVGWILHSHASAWWYPLGKRFPKYAFGGHQPNNEARLRECESHSLDGTANDKGEPRRRQSHDHRSH